MDTSTADRSRETTLKTTILSHPCIFQLAEGLHRPPEQAIIASTSPGLERREKTAKCGGIPDPHDEEKRRPRRGWSAWGKGEGSVPGDQQTHRADADEERPGRAPRPCVAALPLPGTQSCQRCLLHPAGPIPPAAPATFPLPKSCVNQQPPPPPPHYGIHPPRPSTEPFPPAPLPTAVGASSLSTSRPSPGAGRGGPQNARSAGPPALSAAREGGGAGETAQRGAEKTEEPGRRHHASPPPPRLGDTPPAPAARKGAGRKREGRGREGGRGERGREERERPRREERTQRCARHSAAPTLTGSRSSEPASAGGGASVWPIAALRLSLLPTCDQSSGAESARARLPPCQSQADTGVH